MTAMDTERAFGISADPSACAARIDQPAPDFAARSTRGPVQLGDFRGRWLVFFSHPADFTPVCSSEFLAFQRALPRFEALDCALLGLSVDSLYAHLAWVNDLASRFGEEITFPIVEDISMAVARAYGMLDEESGSTATVRSVFFIDPHGVVRAIIHYPANVGRSVEEILRVLAALQGAAASGLNAPEGWRPGDPMLLPPPEDVEAARSRGRSAPDATWYYVTEEPR